MASTYCCMPRPHCFPASLTAARDVALTPSGAPVLDGRRPRASHQNGIIALTGQDCTGASHGRATCAPESMAATYPSLPAFAPALAQTPQPPRPAHSFFGHGRGGVDAAPASSTPVERGRGGPFGRWKVSKRPRGPGGSGRPSTARLRAPLTGACQGRDERPLSWRLSIHTCPCFQCDPRRTGPSQSGGRVNDTMRCCGVLC